MQSSRRFEIRPAEPDDLMMIASVLVRTWRATFRGIIADDYLDAMTVEEQAIRHARRMRFPGTLMMAAADMDEDRVVGFANYGKARGMPPAFDRELYELYLLPEFHRAGLGSAFDRELYELYLLPEFHRAGLGSALVRAVAAHCQETGGNSLFAWVLKDNPNRAFYEKLGARAVAQGRVSVGRASLDQLAYRWDDLRALSGDASA
ncbi:GNAT family N-acetyltransferase [Sinorhizobium medicae]|uniref:GNAT family N-acetyltransferase n=1 Tax=Sinorhizobium medicae TaxID=110321 RepID=UPI000C7A1084|nr:GNAT family N-acetyltransferase [Sinorhizobium medicae]PLU04410.1 GNAT family N-acetyltransferase [Sinorhizobium medicae]